MLSICVFFFINFNCFCSFSITIKGISIVVSYTRCSGKSSSDGIFDKVVHVTDLHGEFILFVTYYNVKFEDSRVFNFIRQ